ncbi:MAG: hypothetical protein FP820_02515 [Sulfurimonas sp.]|nr:hypothetical protein [Sulfurimonas sp.]MBU3938052.1 hypothetical protein [bacterium]
MYKSLLSLALASSLFAVSVEIKKSDVTLSLNTQELTLQENATRNVEEGSTICYLSGEGKINIPALKRQLKKTGQCLMIPISQSTADQYIKSIKDMTTIAYWDPSENVRHGAGTKGELEYESKELHIAKGQAELIINGKEFGPLPVVALLKDKEGNEIAKFENEESDTTFFRISRYFLNKSARLEIYDGFDKLLLSQKIILEAE